MTGIKEDSINKRASTASYALQYDERSAYSTHTVSQDRYSYFIDRLLPLKFYVFF